MNTSTLNNLSDIFSRLLLRLLLFVVPCLEIGLTILTYNALSFGNIGDDRYSYDSERSYQILGMVSICLNGSALLLILVEIFHAQLNHPSSVRAVHWWVSKVLAFIVGCLWCAGSGVFLASFDYRIMNFFDPLPIILGTLIGIIAVFSFLITMYYRSHEWRSEDYTPIHPTVVDGMIS